MPDEYFFNHLGNITTLCIKAPKEGPLGLMGNNQKPHASLALNLDHMPLLTTMHLEYIFATPELINVLVSHKVTLEKLTMRNCYACTEYSIYWSQFFTSVFSARPALLRQLELFSREIPLSPDENKEGLPIEDHQAYTILGQDSSRRLFPYGFVHDMFGTLYDAHEANLEAFWRGEDQKCWDRLMGLMEGNAKEAPNGKNQDMELYR